MMFKPKKAIALLALAGLALASTAVNAATTYTTGDLILAFRTSNPLNTTTLLVDLGSSSNFRGTNVTTGALSTGALGTALSTWYGSSAWSTDPNVTWGIVGTIGSASQPVGGVNGVRDLANTLYGTQNEATYGVNATPLNVASNSIQGNVRADVTTMALAFAGQTQVAGLNATIQANGATSSWNSYQSGSDISSQGFSFFSNLEGGFANGVAGNNSALDLFRFAPSSTAGTPSQLLGTFTINSAGQVSFATPAAVPEPSRVAFVGLGLGAFLMRRRRATRVVA